MEYNALRTIAEQQHTWQNADGAITQLDAADKIIELKVGENHEEYTLSKDAFEQALQRLTLKGTYDDWMQSKDWMRDSDIMQKAIDERVKQFNINTRIRDTRVIHDGTSGKAVVTTAYQRLDQLPILDHLDKVHQGKFDPKFSYINDNKMMVVYTNATYISIRSKSELATLEEKDIELEKGDIMGFGYRIWNSQTGHSTLTAGQFILRLVCTNGMVSKMSIDLIRQKHIHADLMERLTLGLRRISAVDETAKTIQTAMFRPAKIKKIEDFSTLVDVNKEHHPGIIQAYEAEPLGTTDDGINGWGIYNAITRYASRIYPQQNNYAPAAAHELFAAAYPLLKV